jgi:K+-sensing histidine kinase KdpD
MSDMMEIDTGDEMATRIVAVGEAVSRAAEELKLAAERLLAEEERVKQVEETARTAEEQIRRAELRAERAEGDAGWMTSSLADAEARAKEATDRFEELEERTGQAELRARAAEDQAAHTAAKSSELLEELQKTRGQLAEVEGRFRRADERAHEAEEKARLLDSQVQELKARLAEIKKLHVGGMPVVADKERSTLKDAVAGEVRRPLTSILGIALAMKHTDPKAADGQEMIRQLSSNARKLDRLVSVLLELERLMDGSLKPNRRRTDLQALVRRVVEESPDLSNREVKIEAEHVVVAVDPSMTEQMVDSLLANAGRRATPGTPVWIKVTTDPEGAVIAVDDTSPEVPDGIRRSTLAVTHGRPAERAATGMSLLARLADVHGGKAWVEERQGGGASFRVFLPDVMEGADPRAPGIALREHDGAADETVTI